MLLARRCLAALDVLAVLAVLAGQAAMHLPDRDGVVVLRDLPYVEGSGRPDQRLDLYLPQGPGPRPVVLWIHGGKWSLGSRQGAVTRAFTARGLAVASVDYRLAPAARFPAQLADCQAAVRWLRRNAESLGLDGERIAAFGVSAGGHLAALLATGAEATPEGAGCAAPGSDVRVRAAVDWCGPSDLLGGGQDERALRRMAAVLLGGPPLGRQALARAADPARCASADAARMLIVHGTADALVPPRHSVGLHEALTRRGAQATLELLPGAGHDFQSPERYEEAAAFLAGALAAGPEAL